MQTKTLLLTTGCVLPFLGVRAEEKSAGVTASRYPNVILFYIDDLGYGDLTLTGAQGYTTPNIDRLAHDGMFFTQFYSPSAVSSASRAGLMTGCYPNRVSIYGALMPGTGVGLNPEEQTIPKILKEIGYKTCIVGKWHLGDEPQFLPLQMGFDEYLGLPYSNDMWPYGYSAKRGDRHPEVTNKKSPKLPLYEGSRVLEYIESQDDQDELTTRYTDYAVDFIKRNHGNPFFLYVAHTMPHVPLGVSGKFRGKSEQGAYGDVMMELDWSVHQIVETLEKEGLTNNTIVIFTSDNGPWINFGDQQGSAGGLKEAKHTSMEGGQRVPCIVKWPNVVPAGLVCNRLASAIDILPTLVEITGATMPENKIDGVSLLPLWQGDLSVSPRDLMFYYYGNNNLRAVRDARFKLILPHKYFSYENSLPRDGGYPGKMCEVEVELALFDLRRDPGERYDVNDLYAEEVLKLQKVVAAMREDIGDSITSVEGKNVRPSGCIDEIHRVQ